MEKTEGGRETGWKRPGEGGNLAPPQKLRVNKLLILKREVNENEAIWCFNSIKFEENNAPQLATSLMGYREILTVFTVLKTSFVL